MQACSTVWIHIQFTNSYIIIVMSTETIKCDDNANYGINNIVTIWFPLNWFLGLLICMHAYWIPCCFNLSEVNYIATLITIDMISTFITWSFLTALWCDTAWPLVEWLLCVEFVLTRTWQTYMYTCNHKHTHIHTEAKLYFKVLKGWWHLKSLWWLLCVEFDLTKTGQTNCSHRPLVIGKQAI